MKLQKALAIVGIAMCAAVLSGCGAKSEPPTTAPVASAPAATKAPATGPKVLKVVTLNGFSPLVTNGTGRTIYRFDKDTTDPAKSNCADACTATWEPVLAGPGDSFAIDGTSINKNLLGFIDRPEGRQVTLKGWPLYYFINDKTLGQTAGHGTGGVWFAIAPDGSKAKRTDVPAPSASAYSY